MRLSFPTCNFQANAFQTDSGPAFQFINLTDSVTAIINVNVTASPQSQMFLSAFVQVQVIVTSNNVKPPIISASLVVPGAGVPAMTEIVFSPQNFSLLVS